MINGKELHPDDIDIDDSLKVDTQFLGTRRNPNIKGSISNLSLNNFSPEYFITGFLYGIVREFYDFFMLIPENETKKKTQLTGSGNGLKKNFALCCAFEKIFGVNIKISPIQEEAAIGAAMCPVIGQGVIRNFRETDKIKLTLKNSRVC